MAEENGIRGEEHMASRPLRQEEPESVRDLKKRRRRQRCCLFCGITLAILVFVVLILVILALTVFKEKDPEITVTSVTFDDFQASLDRVNMRFHLNMTLDMEMSIKNPNKVSFKFGNSTTLIYYRGSTVGEAFLPPGKIKADKTVDLRVSVTILTDNLASNANLFADGLSGSLPLSTYTKLSGRINVFNIIKKHADISAKCDFTVVFSTQSVDKIANQSVKDMTCSRNVKL